MAEKEAVRWFLSFWHSEGTARDDADFPAVEFWHLDRESARAEAARVLIELREQRGDTRDWTAAGHPDPYAVANGRHPGGQWILRYRDLQRDGENGAVVFRGGDGRRLPRSAAGVWRGVVDAEGLKQTLSESRMTGSRIEHHPAALIS